MSEYYTSDKKTSSLTEKLLSANKIIKSSENHITRNILIESVLNDSNLKQINDVNNKHNFIIMFEININKDIMNLSLFLLIFSQQKILMKKIISFRMNINM